jgi:hypothetical protein
VNRPSAPVLEEFRLIGEADLSRPGELDRLADAICDLFTDDCLLEDTSTTEDAALPGVDAILAAVRERAGIK